MMTSTTLRYPSMSVIDYRCSAAPSDAPFVELHRGYSVSYVRKGSFGYCTRGRSFELVAGSILVSYTRARAEALGLKGDVGIGSRAERVVVITAGLVLAPWGVLPWAIYLLAATAWFTVGQRIWSVRAQLRARP